MADDFGLRIGLDGEKAFKQSIKDINAQFKVLGSEMNVVSARFGRFFNLSRKCCYKIAVNSFNRPGAESGRKFWGYL